jgi:hypothetical protein
VVKYFYKYAEALKIPIFVLLDKDAKTNYEEIKPKLRDFDKVHVLDAGEFEDLFTLELVEKALDKELKNISIMNNEVFKQNLPMAKKLEELFKTRGMHEFKKSEFAQEINSLPLNENDLSKEVKAVINEISIQTLNSKG